MRISLGSVALQSFANLTRLVFNLVAKLAENNSKRESYLSRAFRLANDDVSLLLSNTWSELK